MNYEELLDEAKKQISRLPNETIFEVKELFSGTKWNALERGARVGFGQYFSAKVKLGEVLNIERIGENKNHHNRYKKRDGFVS